MSDFDNSGPKWAARPAKPRQTWPLLLAAVLAICPIALVVGLLTPVDPALAPGPRGAPATMAESVGYATGYAFVHAQLAAGAVWGVIYLIGLRRAGWNVAGAYLAIVAAVSCAVVLPVVALHTLAERHARDLRWFQAQTQAYQQSVRDGSVRFGQDFRNLHLANALSASALASEDLAQVSANARKARVLLAAYRTEVYARTDAFRAKIKTSYLEPQDKAEALGAFNKGFAQGEPLIERIFALEDQIIVEIGATLDDLRAHRGAWQVRGQVVSFAQPSALSRFRNHRQRLNALAGQLTAQAEMAKRQGAPGVPLSDMSAP